MGRDAVARGQPRCKRPPVVTRAEQDNGARERERSKRAALAAEVRRQTYDWPLFSVYAKVGHFCGPRHPPIAFACGDERVAVMQVLRAWLEGTTAAGRPQLPRASVHSIAAVLMGVLTEEDGCPALLSEALCALRSLIGVGGDSPLRVVVAAAESADSAVSASAVRALAVMVLRRSRLQSSLWHFRQHEEEVACHRELLQLATRLIERHSGDEDNRADAILTACVVAAAELLSSGDAAAPHDARLTTALRGLVHREEVHIVTGALDCIAAATGPRHPQVLAAAEAAVAAVVARHANFGCSPALAQLVSYAERHFSRTEQAAFVAGLYRQLPGCGRAFADDAVRCAAALPGALEAALDARLIQSMADGVLQQPRQLSDWLAGATHEQLLRVGDQDGDELKVDDWHSSVADAMQVVRTAAWARKNRVLLRYGGQDVRDAQATLADVGVGMEAGVEFVDVCEGEWQRWSAARGEAGRCSFGETVVYVRWRGYPPVPIELPGDSTVFELACRAAEYFRRECGYRLLSAKAGDVVADATGRLLSWSCLDVGWDERPTRFRLFPRVDLWGERRASCLRLIVWGEREATRWLRPFRPRVNLRETMGPHSAMVHLLEPIHLLEP